MDLRRNWVIFTFWILGRVSSYRNFQTLIPNGGSVPNPCEVSSTWFGVGHESRYGGGNLNQFGRDFRIFKMWSYDLCMMDSDNDGHHNGEELGDPLCQWRPGTQPQFPAESHPGICDPADCGNIVFSCPSAHGIFENFNLDLRPMPSLPIDNPPVTHAVIPNFQFLGLSSQHGNDKSPQEKKPQEAIFIQQKSQPSKKVEHTTFLPWVAQPSKANEDTAFFPSHSPQPNTLGDVIFSPPEDQPTKLEDINILQPESQPPFKPEDVVFLPLNSQSKKKTDDTMDALFLPSEESLKKHDEKASLESDKQPPKEPEEISSIPLPAQSLPEIKDTVFSPWNDQLFSNPKASSIPDDILNGRSSIISDETPELQNHITEISSDNEWKTEEDSADHPGTKHSKTQQNILQPLPVPTPQKLPDAFIPNISPNSPQFSWIIPKSSSSLSQNQQFKSTNNFPRTALNQKSATQQTVFPRNFSSQSFQDPFISRTSFPVSRNLPSSQLQQQNSNQHPAGVISNPQPVNHESPFHARGSTTFGKGLFVIKKRKRVVRPPFACDGINDANTNSWTIRLPQVEIPRGFQSDVCMVFNLPQAGTYHLIGGVPIIDNRDTLLQMFVYGCDEDATIPVTSDPYPCKGIPRRECQNIIGGYADSIPGICFPRSGGIRIGESGFRQVILQVRWVNLFSRAGLVDSSGMMLYYTEVLRTYDIGTKVLRATHFSIPAGQPAYTVTSTCPGDCTVMQIRSPIYISMAFNHMHIMGRQERVELIRNGRVIGFITDETAFSYDDPKAYWHVNPLQVLPGDSLRMTCVYNSLLKNDTVQWGFDESNEICLATLFYYPKESWMASSCTSFRSIPLCRLETTGIVNNCDFHTFFETLHADFETASILANCSRHHFCDDECHSLAKVAEGHPCLIGDTHDLLESSLELSNDEKLETLLDSLKLCSDDVYITPGIPIARSSTLLPEVTTLESMIKEIDEDKGLRRFKQPIVKKEGNPRIKIIPINRDGGKNQESVHSTVIKLIQNHFKTIPISVYVISPEGLLKIEHKSLNDFTDS